MTRPVPAGDSNRLPALKVWQTRADGRAVRRRRWRAEYAEAGHCAPASSSSEIRSRDCWK
jgi:hypothetical protein